MFKYTSAFAFNFTNEIDKKNWKTWARSDYLTKVEGIMEPLKQFHAHKGGTDIIPS